MSVESVMVTLFNFGVPLAILASFSGFRWREGFWGNSIACFCVLFSVFFAVAWWETFADMLSKALPAILFLSDLIAIWVVFLLSLVILCETTRGLSRVKVAFAPPIEAAGNAIAVCMLFLLLYGFFLFTVDLAPIGEKDDAQAPEDSVAVKAFRILSRGTLQAFVDPHTFDGHGSGGNGEFRTDHLLRRKALMKHCESHENSLFYEGSIPPRKKD